MMKYSCRAVCLATTALLLLTACGNGDDDGAEPAAEPQTTDAAESDAQHEDQTEPAEPEALAEAQLQDGAGNPIGTVAVAEAEQGVRLTADIDSLTAGYRAIAVHENAVCEAASTDESGQVGDFNSAGEVLIGEQEEDPGVVEGEDELAETPGQQAPQPGDEGQAPAPGEPGDPNAGALFSAQLAGQMPPQPNPAPEDDEAPPRAQRAGSLPNLLINDDGTGYMEVVSNRLSEDLLLGDDGTAVIVYTGSDHHGNIPQRYSPYGPDSGSLATGDAGERFACGVLEASE